MTGPVAARFWRDKSANLVLPLLPKGDSLMLKDGTRVVCGEVDDTDASLDIEVAADLGAPAPDASMVDAPGEHGAGPEGSRGQRLPRRFRRSEAARRLASSHRRRRPTRPLRNPLPVLAQRLERQVPPAL